MDVAVEELKKCNRCGEEKPLLMYERDKARPGGRRGICRDCRRESVREQRKVKRDFDREGYRRVWGRYWITRSFSKYGLTLETYDRMLSEQEGLCAICRKPEKMTRNGIVIQLSVDHNHETGKIRGFLCSSCNSMIGHAKEEIVVLQRAIEYLQGHQGAVE